MVVRPQHDGSRGFLGRPEGMKDALLAIEQDRNGDLQSEGSRGSFRHYREKSRACGGEDVVARAELGQGLRDGRSGFRTKHEDDWISRDRVLAQTDRRAVELWQHAIRGYVADRRRTPRWK